MASNVIFVIAPMSRHLHVPLRDQLSESGTLATVLCATESQIGAFVKRLDESNRACGMRESATLTDREATNFYKDGFTAVFEVAPTDVAYVVVDSSLTRISGPDFEIEPHYIRALKALAACHIGIELAAARNRFGRVVYIQNDGSTLDLYPTSEDGE